MNNIQNAGNYPVKLRAATNASSALEVEVVVHLMLSSGGTTGATGRYILEELGFPTSGPSDPMGSNYPELFPTGFTTTIGWQFSPASFQVRALNHGADPAAPSQLPNRCLPGQSGLRPGGAGRRVESRSGGGSGGFAGIELIGDARCRCRQTGGKTIYDNQGLGVFGSAGPTTTMVQVGGTPRLRLSWSPCPVLAGSFFFCVLAEQQYPPYDYASTVPARRRGARAPRRAEEPFWRGWDAGWVGVTAPGPGPGGQRTLA